jgi:hypothetical protein
LGKFPARSHPWIAAAATTKTIISSLSDISEVTSIYGGRHDCSNAERLSTPTVLYIPIATGYRWKITFSASAVVAFAIHWKAFVYEREENPNQQGEFEDFASYSHHRKTPARTWLEQRKREQLAEQQESLTESSA